MDDTMISYPTVNSAITDGNAMITLNGSDDKTRDEAISLANKINSGALPFALTAENYSTISPSLGANSLQAMVIAGVVAFVLVALFMIANYRLPQQRNNRHRAGFDRGLAPVIDGNVTVIIVAVMLMGAFGPTDGFFARMLKPIFFAFGPSTAGTIYSFGYTLLVGVLLNFVFGVICTRVMLKGISKLKCMRNPVLYGGVKNEKTV